jgi:hypothetical protein
VQIYPDREGLNVQVEKYTPRRSQLITRRKRKAPDSRDNTETPPPEEKRSKDSPSSDMGDLSSPSPPLTDEDDDEVEMQVRPHPQDASVTNFPIRNLATVPVATVAHILKYIMDYPSLDKRGPKPVVTGDSSHAVSSKFSLYIQFGDDGQYTMLPGGTTLRQICENYWTPGDKLNLYFALDDRLGETVQ